MTRSALRRFASIDLGAEPVPDETTISCFRHLLEQRHGLGRKLFEQGHLRMEHQGIRVSTGTIVDAAIISAPSSTKKKDRQRNPDMHQTCKGQQWYFGMKGHFGADSRTKVIDTVVATPANVHDSVCLPDLPHERETRVWDDSAYLGRREVIRVYRPRTRDLTNRRYRRKGVVDELERAKNRIKFSICTREEHSIGVIRRIGLQRCATRG